MNNKSLWWVLAFVVISSLVAVGYLYVVNSTPTALAPTTQDESSGSAGEVPGASSAKGVVQLGQPLAGTEIRSPLQVTGFVYGNNGTLILTLKQKESGVTVAEKQAKITGQADQIRFAESMQFALPVIPQPGILTAVYKDASGKGLDDSVSIEVSFPTDLGSGL